MLRYGIPEYRLPREVLDAEIQRILDLGVELKCNAVVGQGRVARAIAPASTRPCSWASARTRA